MNSLLWATIAIGVASVLVYAVLILSGRLRREGFEEQLRLSRCASQLYNYLFSNRPDVQQLERLARQGIGSDKICQTVAALSTLFANIRADRMAEVERHFCLRSYLVERALHSSGKKRTEALEQLCRFTPEKEYLNRLSQIDAVDGYNHALMLALRMAASPRKAFQVIEQTSSELPDTAISLLGEFIVGRHIAIDWQRALCSKNPNLQLIGQRLVVAASLTDSEELLLKGLANAAPEQVFGWLNTIAALRLPLSDRRIIDAVERLSPAERKAVYRMTIRHGYLERALLPLIRCEEARGESLGQYLHSAVGSYKSSLR